eukprot:INCI4798.2.p1 GENE.INCI4798.2~~INCI4798.2.p1  ORF type:complete len:363 (+),score=72.07 INCI4798.2:93-1181(+)
MSEVIELLDDSDFALDDGDEEYNFFIDDDDIENVDAEGTVRFETFEAKIIEREKEVEEARRDCAICLDEIEVRGVIDCCSHSFCFDCISMWGKKQRTCPCCKRKWRRVKRAKKTPKKANAVKKKVGRPASLASPTVESLLAEDAEFVNKENVSRPRRSSRQRANPPPVYVLDDSCDDNGGTKQYKSTAKAQRPPKTGARATAAAKRAKKCQTTTPSSTQSKSGRITELRSSAPNGPRRKTRNGVVWVQNALTGRWTRGRRAAVVIEELLDDGETKLANSPTPMCTETSSTTTTRAEVVVAGRSSTRDPPAFVTTGSIISSCDSTIKSMQEAMKRRKALRDARQATLAASPNKLHSGDSSFTC